MATALKQSKSATKATKKSTSLSTGDRAKLNIYLVAQDVAKKSYLELLEAIYAIEESRHCLLAVTPLMVMLGIEPNPLDYLAEDDLRKIVTHLYATVIRKPEQATESTAIWYDNHHGKRIHSMAYINTKYDKPDDNGEIKPHLHSVSLGFDSNDKAMEFLDYAYKKQQITCGGLRDNIKHFRTEYPFEVKCWGMTQTCFDMLVKKELGNN